MSVRTEPEARGHANDPRAGGTEASTGRTRQRFSRAVILAGGRGTAALPIANVYPKLAFPFVNQPLISYLTRYLRDNGVCEVAVVANGLLRPSEIQGRLAQAVAPGVRLSFLVEGAARGTAGALKGKWLRDFVGGSPFVVVAGGVLAVGSDLRRAIDFHMERGAGVTVLAGARPGYETRVEQVAIDEHGRILNVHIPYQPGSNLAGLEFKGIYVFSPEVVDLIPPGRYFDIKQQLIPLLSAKQIPVWVYRVDGYVRRIDSTADYLAANGELLLETRGEPVGRVGREVRKQVWAPGSTEVASGAEIVGPVAFGPDCRVGRGARVIGPTVVGRGTTISDNALVRESVLWPNSRVATGAYVEHSVVGDDCLIPTGSSVKAKVVLDWGSCAAAVPFLACIDGDGMVMHWRGRLTPLKRRAWRLRGFQVAKRILDLFVSAMLLVFTMPLSALLALAIKLDSPGPVLFRDRRCGRRGRRFMMYKFRTMREGADRQQQELFARKDVDGPMFKMRDDPRVTRTGRRLRRMCLDELPQLINVLKGEMSLVGPRPLAAQEMRFAPSWRDLRLKVKPGMTGLWQITSRRNTGFQDWIRHDIAYVKKQSMRMDLKILVGTVGLVIRAIRAG